MLDIFIAVNKKIVDFTDWKSKVTLANLFGWAGAFIGGVIAFFGHFDWVVPRLLVYLTGNQALATAWPPGDHWGTKTCVFILILVLFYLLVFAFQATVMMTDTQGAIVVAARPDFRVEFARAIGVNFTRVRDYYEVLNDGGDCRVILEADFEVNHLPISHIERKFKSATATSRNKIAHEAQVNPPKTQVDKDFKVLPKESIYHFRFNPTLSLTEPPMTCQTRIAEQLTKGILMFMEDVPEDSVLGGRLESVGHLVQEPTSQLDLEVHFPFGYLVKGDLNPKVRLGATETPHQREEVRLSLEKALQPPRMVDGKQVLRLVINQPLMGLCYYLCWAPPEKPPTGTGTT